MKPKLVRKNLRELHRRDFSTFVIGAFHQLHPGVVLQDNWHLRAMAWHLQSGKTRIVISLPPRYLKSVVASVAYPAWLMGHNPGLRIICVSYSQDLTEKNARQSRQLLESGWFTSIFPKTRLSAEKNAVLQFETTSGGGRFSTSVMGPLTGFGADVIIIDDPLKAEDAMYETHRSAVNNWFDNTLLSRLNDKRTGQIVLVMQRLHQDDLVGYVQNRGEWSSLCLPAIAEQDESIQIGDSEYYERKAGKVLHEAREPMEILQDQKLRMGLLRFSAQYQQAPVPAEGSVIKWSWFPSYDIAPQRERYDIVVQSWDTAYKGKTAPSADFSACITFLVKGNKYYVVHVLREKLDYPSLRMKVREHALSQQADTILIENRASGMSLIDDLRATAGIGEIAPIAITPSKDKLTRMSSESAQIEAGQVVLPSKAVWLDEFRLELLQFPNGKHDDQVDALSQFLSWVKNRRGRFSWDFGNGIHCSPDLADSGGGSQTPSATVYLSVGDKLIKMDPSKNIDELRRDRR